MKKKIERIKELFSKLPNWAHVIVVLILLVAAILLWVIIWDFIRPFTIKWFLNPLGYILMLTIYAGIGLFSGYWLVKVSIGLVIGINSSSPVLLTPGVIIISLCSQSKWLFLSLKHSCLLKPVKAWRTIASDCQGKR